MEIASGKWLSELEMEDPTFFTQYQMMNPIDYSFDDINFQSFSSESYSSHPNIQQKISHNNINGSSINEASHQLDDFRRPTKQLRSNNWNPCITENIPPKASPSSSSHIISFDSSSSSPPAISPQYYGLDCDVKPANEFGWEGNMENVPSLINSQSAYCSPKFQQVSKRVGSLTRTPLHAQDHVIAERKRRERISQLFISLSTLIPSLKKTDKNSILGDAIKYLKQLQARVATLEEQTAKKKTVESVFFVRKTQIYANDETSSSDHENFDGQSNNPVPEIEARVSDKDVLIRIHCEKSKGCIASIINEVEKLHLSVLSSHALPFGQDTLHITIVAQMEAEFSMTLKDLVKSLRLALLKFM